MCEIFMHMHFRREGEQNIQYKYICITLFVIRERDLTLDVQSWLKKRSIIMLGSVDIHVLCQLNT